MIWEFLKYNMYNLVTIISIKKHLKTLSMETHSEQLNLAIMGEY